MKVLFLIDSLPRGGKERRMIELLKGLQKEKGIETGLVIFSSRVQYKEVFNLGLSIHTITRKSKKDLSVFTRLYGLCKKECPDIIHSWGSLSTIYAIPAAKMLGIKLINGNITNAPLNLKLSNRRYLLTKLSYPFVDMIIGNSQAGLNAYRTPKGKSECVFNGFDFKRIKNLSDPESIRQKLGIETRKLVGMVGTFDDRKDHETFIEAAICLLDKGHDVTFLAIGDGPNRISCEAIVPSKYQDKILFPGLSREVESVVQIFDVGVLSTNTKVHGEGVSNAIMEYMALEKPVVATNGGGTPEIVLDGETGYLVQPFAPEMLADKIEYLFDHPDVAKTMGQKGKERVKSEFSLQAMTDSYLLLYRKLGTERADNKKPKVQRINGSDWSVKKTINH